MKIKLLPFSSMSICLIFFLLRILIATLCPVRTCSAILTCFCFSFVLFEVEVFLGEV